jgi:hypothetical protein
MNFRQKFTTSCSFNSLVKKDFPSNFRRKGTLPKVKDQNWKGRVCATSRVFSLSDTKPIAFKRLGRKTVDALMPYGTIFANSFEIQTEKAFSIFQAQRERERRKGLRMFGDRYQICEKVGEYARFLLSKENERIGFVKGLSPKGIG